MAAMRGHLEVVMVLCKEGVNPNTTDKVNGIHCYLRATFTASAPYLFGIKPLPLFYLSMGILHCMTP